MGKSDENNKISPEDLVGVFSSMMKGNTKKEGVEVDPEMLKELMKKIDTIISDRSEEVSKINSYIRILDTRTKTIMEDREEEERKFTDYQPQLDELKNEVAKLREFLETNIKTEGPDETLEDKLQSMKKSLDSQIREIRQDLKDQEAVIGNIKKKTDVQVNSDMKIAGIDRKFRSAFIGQFFALVLAFVLPFVIISFTVNRINDSINESRIEIEKDVEIKIAESIKNYNESDGAKINKAKSFEEKLLQKENPEKKKTSKQVESVQNRQNSSNSKKTSVNNNENETSPPIPQGEKSGPFTIINENPAKEIQVDVSKIENKKSETTSSAVTGEGKKTQSKESFDINKIMKR